MILFFDVVPSARTAGMYFEKYGSFFTSAVMSASWPFSPSVRASVKGTSNTVGSVPAASLAANVGPVHWYSTGFTMMFGLAFSNCATWLLNCWIAASLLPGISDATLIVTFAAPAEPGLAAALETATAHKTSRLVTATAAIVALRVDFIVTPFLCTDARHRRESVIDLSIARCSGKLFALAEPDRGVLRKCTSFELATGDEDGGSGRKLDRVGTEVDDAHEAVAPRKGEHGLGCRDPAESRIALPGSRP